MTEKLEIHYALTINGQPYEIVDIGKKYLADGEFLATLRPLAKDVDSNQSGEKKV